MRNIRLKHVNKAFGDDVILENLSLTIPGGSFFALLGPSGSGKTTLLRLIAGFETVDSGEIYIGDHNITHIPINKRNINTVFQHYALFPHMNVFENVAYGLVVKGIAKGIIEQKVRRTLKKVHLERHIYKPIQRLSGGQQQRVALARAIINEPDVLLLDEPLAALDLKLRERMLVELIDLQSELKTTFVYVTHDQFEALTVADYMAIMNYDGEIEQVGTPKDIYEFPISSFVAKFVGSTNIFKGVLQEKNGGFTVEVPELGCFEVAMSKRRKFDIASTLLMSLRPEKIEINKKEQEGFANHLTGTVEAIIYYGRSTQYTVKLKNGFKVSVFEQNEEHFPHEVIDYDDVVHLYWQKENVVLLER